MFASIFYIYVDVSTFNTHTSNFATMAVVPVDGSNKVFQVGKRNVVVFFILRFIGI